MLRQFAIVSEIFSYFTFRNRKKDIGQNHSRHNSIHSYVSLLLYLPRLLWGRDKVADFMRDGAKSSESIHEVARV